MASDDVIELGSSDEETEPAPKKRKPPPNAIVHIPNKLPGITIKPSKSTTKINPVCFAKGSLGKSLTVTKISKPNINPFANTKKNNGKPIKGLPPGKIVPVMKRNVQIPIQRNDIGPVSHSGVKILNSQLKSGVNPLNNRTGIKSFTKNNPVILPGGNNLNFLKIIKKPEISVSVKSDAVLKRPSPKNLNKILPPGITVKRADPTNSKPNISMKRIKMLPTVVRMSKTGLAMSVTRDSEVSAVVDLDDDEPATCSASGPQWYLRPEEEVKSQQETPVLPDLLKEISPEDKTENSSETEKLVKESPEKTRNKSPNKPTEESAPATEPSKLEQQNNKEPDKTNYIEITIEDSPIKPAQIKNCFKVGAELAITIEDSPIKNTAEKESTCNSDDEQTISQKDRNSKKKLEYKTIELVETVEIEFEPLPPEEPTNDIQNIDTLLASTNTEDTTDKPKSVVECIDIVEIEESPVKPQELVKYTTPKKNKSTKPDDKMSQIDTVVLEDTDKDEFVPIYQSFINLCFQLENSEDMKKIVEKKIKAYYRQVPKEYTDSEYFTDMVASKIMAIKAGPEKMYLYIKDVVDELNLQRKMAKAQSTAKELKKDEQEEFLYGEESEFDSKRQRQIRKLEKTLKKLHRAIQKLEEQEVDFDDEEDSVYLLTDRYKERMVRVHAKLCQLTNTKMPSEARVVIDARPGQPKGPAKRLEKWINRKVPIGTPMRFPDFHDVLRCVREANQEDKLGWNEADIMEEARDLFTRCGKKLQRRRQENEWRLAASRIPADIVDPAEDSLDLKKKLEENKRLAAKKEIEVFNKYADRQNQLKLEAVEIGDKEAEESPIESDDEELVEDTDSMTNKEKRKERLKRLLHEKSKKVSDKKESQPDEQPVETNNSKNEAAQISSNTRHSISDTEKQTNTENKDNESDILNKIPLDSHLNDKDNNKLVEFDPRSKNSDIKQSDNIHSLSDDSNKIESDIDELHLLQKLYSENERNNSVIDSSDSSSPIAISDTSSVNDKTSGDDRRNKKHSSDVISIENSSYSESEEKKGDSAKDMETDILSTKKAVEAIVNVNMELECSNDGVGKKTNKINNEEYNGCLEDILLASSDEGDEGDTELRKNNNHDIGTCTNLKDDNISIGETVIEEKDRNTDSSSVEGMEIGPTAINLVDQNGRDKNIEETTGVKSIDEGSITEITNLKSLEAYENGNAVEATSIKSVETIDDENISETRSVQSVEIIDGENINDTRSIKSVENISETRNIKSVETIVDENVNETRGIKTFATIEDGNTSEKVLLIHEWSIESVETVENERRGIKSVENIDARNINETCVNSAKIIDGHNINHTEGQSKSVNTINDAKSTEHVAADNGNESCNKVHDTVEDETITKNSGDSSFQKEKEVVMNITEDPTANKVVESEKASYSIPEPMEVDSNAEQSL